jgi:hypothetical protein
MDWRRGYLEIKAQWGFSYAFLNYFRQVSLASRSAFGRVLWTRRWVFIEDILADRDFLPYPDAVLERRSALRMLIEIHPQSPISSATLTFVQQHRIGPTSGSRAAKPDAGGGGVAR